MNNRATILAFGVAAIMLVIGVAIGSVAFPMTKTTITKLSTATDTSTTTVLLFPQNEVVTKEIIQIVIQIYPVVTSTKCGIVGGGTLGLSTSYETSFTATTTASTGTTITKFSTQTVNTVTTFTNNNVALTYETTVNGSTITTYQCETIA